jgi:hypothetical protein
VKNETYLQPLINLLTKENITMNLEDVETASFNLKARSLTLPNYVLNFDSVIVNERLVCHETAHGLFSPEDLFTSRPQYNTEVVNALEDIRIENNFKEQFPGSNVLFYKGYMKFMEIYKIESGKDLLNDPNFHKSFINRLTSYFKSNYVYPVNFNENELSLVEDLKTFKDISLLNEFIDRLLNLLKDEQEQQNQDNQQQLQGKEIDISSKEDSGDEEDQEDDSSDDAEETSLDDEDSEEETSETNSSKNTDSLISLEEQAELLEDEFEEQREQERFIKNYSLLSRNSYFKKKLIFKPEEPLVVHFDQFWDAIPKKAMEDYFASTISFYQQIETNSATLSAEFNRLKSAKNFREVKHVKNGTLDLSKLHGYRTSMDLFSTFKKKKKEKNHELIILLDWSGSIRHSLFSLAIQTSILFHFCCKNNIGIKVFAFSDNKFAREKFFPEQEYENDNYKNPLLWFEVLSSKTENVKASIVNFLSLTSIIKELELSYYYLKFLALGGTPLYRSLAAIGKTLGELYSPEKSINLITLTDGVSDRLSLLERETSTFDSTNVSILDIESNKLFNSVNLLDDVSVRSFLFERLKVIVPQLKILHIHVCNDVDKRIFDSGLLYLNPGDPSIKILLKKLRSENYVFSQFKDFNSLIYIQNFQEESKRNELLLDDLKISSKSVATRLLETLNNSLSKKIFQKISENIS